MRYLTASRTASMAAWKQPAGVEAATIGSGLSPWRPYSAISRSAASVLVGMPVEGPARCTSITTSGSSIATARPTVSALRSMPGPLVAVTPRWPENAAPSAMFTAAISSSAWIGAHAEAPVARERVQQLGGRGDRVARVEQAEPGAHAGGDQAHRQRARAVDVAVGAGRRRGGLHLVVHGQQLGGLAEVVARAEGGQVGVAHRRVVGELLLDPVDRRLGGPAVHPRHEAEREQVLRARGVARADALDPLGGAHRSCSSSARGTPGSRRASRPRAGPSRSPPS